ncbi:MAG: bifunctional hydroxymethylpyrimidine kinase/phosphomethylpyrimidine kinase [Halobacteriota archaeon]|nr:bifunctional hydroxymethylpyrimidine kinase/phosphomethylpyrimidine kinase [Halobacteriota archaeon]
MSPNKTSPVVMSIAGSDSSGGAGIEADIKTFSALGVHGTCVVTSVTSQNGKGIQSIFDLPQSEISMQFESIITETNITYAKSGMLHTKETVKTVSELVKKNDIPLVIDPVMSAEAGGLLLNKDARETMVHDLIPVARVITPNIYEASILSGIDIGDKETAIEAANKIAELGVEAVIITGGHAIEKMKDRYDLLLSDGEVEIISGEFFDGKAHGTGCTYSAAICARLALGDNYHDAAISSKEFVLNSISRMSRVGSAFMLNHTGMHLEFSERYMVLEDLKIALRSALENERFHILIPEVGMNIGMAIKGAENISDVAAIDGRIHKVSGRAKAAGPIDFGASDHVSRIILTVTSFDARMRGGMNIKYSEEILSACKELEMSIASFDRRDEPLGVKSMDWGVSDAISRSECVVSDIIFDPGDVGKEPMIRILGRSATEVVTKALKILDML